jgi:hypothetical protein
LPTWDICSLGIVRCSGSSWRLCEGNPQFSVPCKWSLITSEVNMHFRIGTYIAGTSVLIAKEH